MALPGVFCLEGEWDRDLRQRMSVEPVLELLERIRLARYIHRDVATITEFEYYLKKWGQKGYQRLRGSLSGHARRDGHICISARTA